MMTSKGRIRRVTAIMGMTPDSIPRVVAVRYKRYHRRFRVLCPFCATRHPVIIERDWDVSEPTECPTAKRRFVVARRVD